MNIRQFAIILPVAFVALCALSCTKDPIDNSGGIYVEGRKTCISLHIGMPAMSVATRADMTDGTDSQVNSLWVGIFSAKDGSCTYAGFRKEIPKLHGEFLTLSDIETLSGKSYIVAVANPENNFGYRFYPENPTNSLNPQPLTELLPRSADQANEDGFTWESYRNLAVPQLDPRDVLTPMGNLVMSGIYYDSETDPAASAWELANLTPVDIPAAGDSETKLPGAIHLRRLISQVTFNIKAVDYTQTDPENNPKSGLRIIEVIPQSYQVRNVPYTSWLHERQAPDSPDAVTTIQDANSGDKIRVGSTPNKNFSFTYDDSNYLPLRSNYRNSAWFSGSQYITANYKTDDETGQQTKEAESYTFDFWMLENKRWAAYDLEGDYDLREKETKESSKNDSDDVRNTGIYTALCGENGSETMNNCATFVEIRCRILYTEDGLKAIQEQDEYRDVEYRTAEAIYTIHLGGINSDWNDFTHRRNHRYTYNITVMDIDRILVEAHGADETRPGIEGVVTDVMTAPFEIDCHYAVFNIQLSNAERTGRLRIDGNSSSIYEQDVFPFRVRYYDENDMDHYIDQYNVGEYIDENDPTKELYWTWVEFRATESEEYIADYKPYKKEDETDEIKRANADGLTFRLNQVADLENFPGAKNSDETDEQYEARKNDPEDTTPRWYTVFVNEYVYETSPNEDTDDSGASINNWTKYVNLSPRMCWLNTLANSSSDGESNYIRSKYAIRQRSIQTFYALPDGHSGDPVDAIGMEHLNETFGYNLRWDDVPSEFPGDDRTHNLQNNNGRHNTLLYIFDEGHLTRGMDWSDYMYPNTLQYIEGINNESNQHDVSYQLQDPPYKDSNDPDRKPYYVPKIYTYQDGNRVSATADINTSNYLRILDACMNRNRDNNGNGVIDTDELRWYVPASSEIVDLVLGRNSLVTPLLDYNINSSLQSPGTDDIEQKHQANTRFHFATSNQRVLWAEEGTTINPETDRLEGTWNLPPQNVRCVRALGTDLTTDTNNDLTPAFTTDDATYPTQIYPTYYEQKNQRSYTSEAIDPHQEMTPFNRLCYSGFEFEPELYVFEPVTVDVWVEGQITYPAGYYADGIQDNEHFLGTQEGGSDPDWLAKNPKWFNEGEKHEGEEHVAGMYLPDPKTYSPTAFTGSQYWEKGFWTGQKYGAGKYLPDTSTYDGNSEKPDDGYYYEWWDTFSLGGDIYPAGYYWPDPSSGPSQTQLPGYEWFSDFGDMWYRPGEYAPIISTYQSTWFWGSVYFPNTINWGDPSSQYSSGYYLPDVNKTGNATTQYINEGFWTGIQHEAGYYARDISREYLGDNQLPNGGYGYPSLTRFTTSISVGGITYQAGWYKPDPSTGPSNSDDPGYKQLSDFYNGQYYQPGYYGPDPNTLDNESGNAWYHPNEYYKRFESFWDKTLPAGYYADNGEGEYLGTDVPTDPAWDSKNPKLLPQKTVKTEGAWEPREVSGQWTDANNVTNNLFAYNEGNFVENHGTTLAAANKICQQKQNGKNKGNGWRLPNMKEAALIKIAMDNAGVYKQNGLTHEKYHHDASGYDVGNFLACTFREFGILQETRTDKTGYYTGIYYPEADNEVQSNDWHDTGQLMGRIACITTGYNRHFYIRCVRDLQ